MRFIPDAHLRPSPEVPLSRVWARWTALPATPANLAALASATRTAREAYAAFDPGNMGFYRADLDGGLGRTCGIVPLSATHAVRSHALPNWD